MPDYSVADAEQLAAKLRADVTARLSAVCAEWPPEMFEAVVAGIVAVTLKYDIKSDTMKYDRRTIDRLVQDMKELADRAARSREHGSRP